MFGMLCGIYIYHYPPPFFSSFCTPLCSRFFILEINKNVFNLNLLVPAEIYYTIHYMTNNFYIDSGMVIYYVCFHMVISIAALYQGEKGLKYVLYNDLNNDRLGCPDLILDCLLSQLFIYGYLLKILVPFLYFLFLACQSAQTCSDDLPGWLWLLWWFYDLAVWPPRSLFYPIYWDTDAIPLLFPFSLNTVGATLASYT